MLVKNYGLYWREEDIFWGRGRQPGALYGVPAKNTTAEPANFREQSGVYVLYADYSIVYVGQAGGKNQKLFDRLKQHRRDSLANRWNQFSWFGTRKVLGTTNGLSTSKEGVQTEHSKVLDHIEAILIHAAEPALNRQGGRFGKGVEQFIQRRDENLGPTIEEMVRSIWGKES